MRALFKKVSQFSLAIVLVFGAVGPASAKSDSVEATIVFVEKAVPQGFETKVKALGGQITVVPEIGFVKVSHLTASELAQLKRMWAKDIRFVGKDVKMKAHAQDLAKGLDSVLDQRATIGLDGVVLGKPAYEPSLEKVEHALQMRSQTFGLHSDAAVIAPFTWDVAQTTNNGATYGINQGNKNIKVAVLDSGIDFEHPDLQGSILGVGRSYVPGDETTDDHEGHGTSVAGQIAANGLMLGVGPGLGVMPYKVLGADGVGDASWVLQAIIDATNDDMDVINMSLGGYVSLLDPEGQAMTEAMSRAIEYAYHQGSVVVSATGNDGLDISDPKKIGAQVGMPEEIIVALPAGVNPNQQITVGASSKLDGLAYYSNYGIVDVVAPGGDLGPNFPDAYDIESLVLSTHPLDVAQPELVRVLGIPEGYTLTLGTSFAAPKVSAVIGVLMAQNKDKWRGPLVFEEVNALFRNHAIDLGEAGVDPYFGVGRVNLETALRSLK
ncbi:MAG: S8 family serine peptidase [Bacilli bacterium]